MDDQTWLKDFKENFEHAVCISAINKIGTDELLEKIIQQLAELFIEINVDVPIQRMDLVNLVHEEGEVYSIKYYNDKINIRASVPSNIVGQFQKI